MPLATPAPGNRVIFFSGLIERLAAMTPSTDDHASELDAQQKANDQPADVPRALSEHEVETVESLADFHLKHYEAASRLQSIVDEGTNLIARPAVVALVCIIAVSSTCWLFLDRNSLNGRVLTGIEYVATFAALIVALLVLATQRSEDKLSARRDKLTLELAIIQDKKTSKLIALMEELRRDAPRVKDRTDLQTEAMIRTTDPAAVLESLEGRSPKI